VPRGRHCRTPFVTSGLLYTDDEATTGTCLDTPAWFAWLQAGTTFYYDAQSGSFTAHCERRPRGGCYWIAYRRQVGILRRVHLGKPQQLTRQRLDEVLAFLNPSPWQPLPLGPPSKR
jgi:LuxR family maltose regulon positive regulatory protein